MTILMQRIDEKILAFDFGSKRIGLALWNPGAQLASLLPVLQRTVLKKDLEKIAKLISEHGIQAFLVGLPIGLDGKITPSTKNAQFWVEELKKHFELPVYTHDESLSTKDALAEMKHLPAQKKKELKDSAAALMILEDFIRFQLENKNS